MKENDCNNSDKNDTKSPLTSDAEYHAVFIPPDSDNVLNTSPGKYKKKNKKPSFLTFFILRLDLYLH